MQAGEEAWDGPSGFAELASQRDERDETSVAYGGAALPGARRVCAVLLAGCTWCFFLAGRCARCFARRLPRAVRGACVS